MKLIVLGARFGQACAAAIVLGLSSTVIKWQKYPPLPAETGFGAFVGGYGLVAAAIGLVAAVTHFIPDKMMLIVDGLAVACFAISGITLSIRIRGMNCAEDFIAMHYKDRGHAFALFDGGYDNEYKKYGCTVYSDDDSTCDPAAFVRKCHTITADAASIWIAFLACILAAGLAWRSRTRGSVSRTSTA
nr:hypothetical protein B0A51_13521 [Rachicladosporium sp. CCFEE 5018]